MSAHLALELIRDQFPLLSDGQWSEPFHSIGIDSFDMVQFRTALEKKTDHAIADSSWIAFTCFADLLDYYRSFGGESTAGIRAKQVAARRAISINMPQMAMSGLSENWLLKELGDLHWGMICSGLGIKSHQILDNLGNRLYATFVRLRIESTHSLGEFPENGLMQFAGGLVRFGKGVFISQTEIKVSEKAINASLMSTFSIRDSDNTALLRGQLEIPAGGAIEECQEMPAFGVEFNEVRKGLRPSVKVGETDCPTEKKEILFETDHAINPYADSNGVSLLYFASYPALNDVCELKFMKSVGRTNWASSAYTVVRDVFYYGNANLDDAIVYQLHSVRWELGDTRVVLFSSLRRKSDGKLIADIFTAKHVAQ